MDKTIFTIYFRNFPKDIMNEELVSEFEKFGSIEKFFISKDRTYGMVEYADISSCTEAIKRLHFQPPFNLYVNMAKNQPVDRKEKTVTLPKKPFNKFQRSPNQNIPMDVTYDEEDFYVDENNTVVNVFFDTQTNEVYVPIRYATSIRKFTRKTPIQINQSLDDGNASYDEERLSQVSGHSGRKIKYDNSTNNIKVECVLDNATKSSSTPRNRFSNNYPNTNVRRSFNNMFDKEDAPKHFDNRKKFSDNSNLPNNATKPFRFNGKRSTNYSRDNQTVQSSTESRQLNGMRQSTSKQGEEDWNISSSNDAGPVNHHDDTTNQRNSIERKSFNNETLSNEQCQDEFQYFQFMKNGYTEVTVESVINETEGWVQLVDDDFLKLHNKLQIESENASKVELQIGKLCIGKYEGMRFRAVIVKTSPKLIVRYIDFGNEEEVDSNDLLKMDASFQRIPAYARRVKLENGAPCKMILRATMKVKPAKFEDDIVTLYVEHGLYDESEIKKPASTDSTLTKIQKELFSKISERDTGILIKTIVLSNNQFVAAIVPEKFAEQIVQLDDLKPSALDSTFRPKVGDICCIEDTILWKRAYIIKIVKNSYEVALIDFGEIKTVEIIKPLPIDSLSIVPFSCVCQLDDNNVLRKLENLTELNFKITKKINDEEIYCMLNDEPKFGKVKISPWTPEPSTPSSINNIQPETVTKCEEAAAASTSSVAKPAKLKLNNGERVKLLAESNGLLYVRTKNGRDLLKEIEAYLKSYKGSNLKTKPNVGDYIAAEYEGEWYRAIVQKIDENNVTVLYIDYGNTELKPYLSLKHLDDYLLKQPWTIIEIFLQNFANKRFSKKSIDFLNNLATKETLLTVSFDKSFEDGVILTNNGINLSDQLMQFDNVRARSASVSSLPSSSRSLQLENFRKRTDSFSTSSRKSVEFEKPITPTPAKPKINVPGKNDKKIMDIAVEPIAIGKTSIKYLDQIELSARQICVSPTDPQILRKVQVELQEQITDYITNIAPAEPYVPVMEECILAENEGKWYRALCVLEDSDDTFTVFYVDFGFINTIPATKIRRIPIEFTEDRALASFAFINGIPENPTPALVNQIETLLVKNQTYQVNVLNQLDTKEYNIVFSIFDNLN